MLPVSILENIGFRNVSEANAPKNGSYFRVLATATAQATVIPTMGLLPAPRKPIISTQNPPFGGFWIGAQGFL